MHHQMHNQCTGIKQSGSCFEILQFDDNSTANIQRIAVVGSLRTGIRIETFNPKEKIPYFEIKQKFFLEKKYLIAVKISAVCNLFNSEWIPSESISLDE